MRSGGRRSLDSNRGIVPEAVALGRNERKNGEIATPVCALVRNDSITGGLQHKPAGWIAMTLDNEER